MYEISIIVVESFQHLGFATSMILQILQFTKKRLSAEEIRAVIHVGNIQSVRLFTNLKFIKISNIQSEF